ncbi:hypothetical protein [Pantoea ananatis]
MFLNYCCSENIYKAEAAYIEEKLASCLLNHDNGGVYFNEMKEAYELVSAISNPPDTLRERATQEHLK